MNRLLLCMFIALVCNLTDVNATHIIGGSITYECVGDDEYLIRLSVKRDCEFGADNAPFDNPANIGIFNSQGQLLTTLGQNGLILANFMGDDTISNRVNSPCFEIDPNVCVHRSVYEEVVRLPAIEGGYILAYQRCCRNQTIQNILEPLQSGSTMTLHITEEALLLCNTSPQFLNDPFIYICSGKQLFYEAEAFDKDGDQLVFRLDVPSSGASIDSPRPVPPSNPPYDPIEFAPGFSLENILGGEALQIDEVTGIISATPRFTGQYLVGIAIDEYRDGVLMSTIRRDFQYNVVLCEEGLPGEFEANQPNCDNPTINFFASSEGINNYEWDFDISNDDPTYTSTEENPSFTYPSSGEYTVQVIGKSADGICRYVSINDIHVVTNTDPANFLQVEVLTCNEDEITYSIRDAYDNDMLIRDWEATGIELPDDVNSQIITVNNNDEVQVSLTLSSILSCSSSDTVTLKGRLNSMAEFEVEILECIEDSLILHLNANSSFPFVSNYRISSETIDEFLLHGDQHVIVVPENEEIIILRTVQSGNCIQQSIQSIDLRFDNQLNINIKSNDCTEDMQNLSFQLSPIIENNYVSENLIFNWTLLNNLGAKSYNTETILVEYSDLIDVEISLEVILENGCILSKRLLGEEIDSVLFDGGLDINIDNIECMDDVANITLSNNTQLINEELSVVDKRWIVNNDDRDTNQMKLELDRCKNVSELTITGITREITAGEGVECTDFIVRNFDNYVAFQFGLQWTPSVLEFVSISTELDNFDFAVPDPQRSELRATWIYDLLPESLSLEDGSTLFSVCFNHNIQEGEMGMINVVSFPNFNIEFQTEDFESVDPCVQQAYFINGQLGSNENPADSVEIFHGDAIEVINTSDDVRIELEIELSNGCLISIKDTIVIPKIDLTFNPDIINDSIAICNNTGVLLLENPNKEYDYIWTPTEGLFFPDPNNSGIVMSNPNTTTTYSVQVSNGTCSEMYNITVIPNLDVEISIVGLMEVCDQTALLEVAGANGIYEWSTSSNFDNIVSVEEHLEFEFEGQQMTFYARAVLNGGQCYSEVEEFTVQQSPIAVTPVIEGLQCVGDTIFVSLVIADPTEAIVVQWDPDPSIVSPLNQSTIAIVPQNTAVILLNYSVTNTLGCEYDTNVDGNAVEINPQEKIQPMEVQINPNCASYEVCFESDYEDGTVLWNFDINSETDNSSTEGSTCFTYPGPGEYMATLMSIDTTSCGFETQIYTINLPEAFYMDIVEAVDSTKSVVYCENQDSISLTIDTNVPIEEVSWFIPNNPLPVFKGPEFTFGVNEYDTIYAGYISQECVLETERLAISMFNFDLEFSPINSICARIDQNISIVGPNANTYEYSWSPSDIIVSGQGSSDVTINQQDDFIINVNVIDPSSGCATVFEQSYSATIIPEINIVSSEGDSIFEGESSILSIDTNSDFSIIWSTGETSPSIEVNPSTTTNYSVEISDAQGCKSSTTFELTVIPAMCTDGYVFLPNAFSPNNDGRNDVLYVRSKFIKELSLDIYDRWGKLIFNTTDADIGWNGQYRNTGAVLAPDAYAYNLRVVCINDEVFTKKGNVSIIQ